MLADLRIACRVLAAEPLVAAVLALSLALGTGANAAIFSLANGLILKPLPVRDPDRLVTISSDFALQYGYRNGVGWNFEQWERLQRRSGAFQSAFAWTWVDFNLAPSGETDRVRGMLASGAFFETLGVPALVGRVFTPQDDVRGGGKDGPVAVIGYGLWQGRFRADRGIVGRRMDLDGTAFTVVGVLPPAFFGIEVGEVLDVVVPLGTASVLPGRGALLDNPGAMLLTLMLRLKPGQSLAAATANLRAMQSDIVESGSRNSPQFAREPWVLVPAATGSTDKSQLRQRYRRPLLIIGGVAACVLLLACLNIANVLLARAATRRHHTAVRLALGASRIVLVRQHLIESLVLAGIGSAAGLPAAIWASRFLVSQLSPTGQPLFVDLTPDWRVLGFSVVAALVTVVLSGVIPGVQASLALPIEAIRAQGRGAVAARTANLTSLVAIAQLAVSTVLLVAAGLLGTTFSRLVHVPLGYDADRMLVVTIETPRLRGTGSERGSAIDRLVASITTVPGVKAAAASIATPGPGGGANLALDARGRAVNLGGPRVLRNGVTPGWFAAYRVPLLAGRDVSAVDTADAPPVVIVNQAYAKGFADRGAVLGSSVEDASAPGGARSVVGIVGDVVYGSARDSIVPTVYLPLAQSAGLGPPSRGTSIQISIQSAGGPPSVLARVVADALSTNDPTGSFSFRIIGDRVRTSLVEERVLAALSGLFGLVAALLAGLGVYGVTAYDVKRRETEFGVRLALGGSPRAVLKLVLFKAARASLIGLVIGFGLSVALSRVVASLLFGVAPRDPLTILVSGAAMAGVALFAAWLPARRAVRVSPGDLLRRA